MEDVTLFQEGIASKERLISQAPLVPLIQDKPLGALGALVPLAESPAPAPAPVPAPALETPKLITEFQLFIKNNLIPFGELSSQIDPVVGELVQFLINAFQEQCKFLVAVSKSKKIPITDPLFASALKPMNTEIEKIINIKDENRQSKFFSHLNTLLEGCPVLGWVVVDTPVSFIPDYKDAAQFWTNRIMKEFKESDPQQVEWARKFLSLFEALKEYVKEYHVTGPAWNAQGGDFKTALDEISGAAPGPSGSGSGSGSAAPPAPSAGGPPPPPPPPPPLSIFEVDSKKEETGMNAVFSALNQGEDITKGLKKVDKSQMTHKNPALRASSTVSLGPKKPVPPKKPTSLSQKAAKKPPKKELVDTKWVVENFEDDHEIVIEGEMQQSVFIGKCSNVTVQIKGKINALSLSECSKVALVVDSLVSGIDVIKCFKYGIQVLQTTPMISIDQSSEGQIYLSKDSLNTDIFTSSTTALNINVPDIGEDEADFKEVPVPEQFKHSFDASGKMTSTIVEHAG